MEFGAACFACCGFLEHWPAFPACVSLLCTMLRAARKYVRSDLKNRRVKIQNQEMDFFTKNLNMISAQGALLAGFAVTALTIGGDLSTWSAFFTVIPGGISTALNLLAVITATFSTIYGPGLALRGPQGSMRKAVLWLRGEQKFAMISHMAGLFFFFVSSIAFFWHSFKEDQSVILSAVLVVALGSTAVLHHRVVERFRIRETPDNDTANAEADAHAADMAKDAGQSR